jgi:hypothetical protein
MVSTNATGPDTGCDRLEPREDCHAGKPDKLLNNLTTQKAQALDVGQLIDKHGHLHSEAVLTAWSPQALNALCIRRVEEGGKP